MKNEEKNTVLSDEVERAKWNLYNQVETATTELSLIPQVIQTLIDYLHLDNSNMSEEDLLNLTLNTRKIHSVLALTQIAIWNTLEKLDEIDKAEISTKQS